MFFLLIEGDYYGEEKQVNQKITALYCCISLDDGGDNESMSISNQKLVRKDIQELAVTVLKDADAFYQRLSSRMERRYMADASEM